MAAEMAMGIWAKNSPVEPDMSSMGRKAATVVDVAAITGPATSDAPLTTAQLGSCTFLFKLTCNVLHRHSLPRQIWLSRCIVVPLLLQHSQTLLELCDTLGHFVAVGRHRLAVLFPIISRGR